ncbi:MAG: GNAT family N-acetyltransferase [Clostridia bacterium]|nr:GNAT family N-acetyltransferase [Clostridia bacterium]
MLKKFNNSDIDELMSIWKKAYIDVNKKIDNKDLARAYTDIKDILLDGSSNTILYTEDDIIEGFITIDKNNRIVIIYVEKKIRREGIGSMLIDSCKKSYSKLDVVFKDDENLKIFFEKNGFVEKENDENIEKTYEWQDSKEEKINLIYFDNDLNDKLISSKKINVKRIDVKEILKEDKNLKSIKNYMRIRKSIEKAFSKKTLLYLNCGNYNEVLDDIIKEIIKIERADFTVVISEPLIIENSKMEKYFKKIVQSYSNYKIHRIDMMENIENDISVNKILEEQMKVIIRQIEKIAENMNF